MPTDSRASKNDKQAGQGNDEDIELHYSWPDEREGPIGEFSSLLLPLRLDGAPRPEPELDAIAARRAKRLGFSSISGEMGLANTTGGGSSGLGARLR